MELNKSILVFRNTSGRQLINAAKCIYRVTVMERCEKRDLEVHQCVRLIVGFLFQIQTHKNHYVWLVNIVQ